MDAKERKGMEIAGGQIDQIESWVEAGNKPFRRPHPPASPPRVAAQPATKHRKCWWPSCRWFPGNKATGEASNNCRKTKKEN